MTRQAQRATLECADRDLSDPLWNTLVSPAERAARLDRLGEPMLELSDPLWNKLDDVDH
jgi:hypothetical protein